MLSPGDTREIEACRSDGWFAVKIVLGGLLIHYALGTLVAIMFLFGWWWGEACRKPQCGEDPGGVE